MEGMSIRYQVLTEGSLIKELPDALLNDISRNKTAFGKNPAFPDIYDCNFIEKLCTDEFREIIDELNQIKRLDFIESETINGAIGEIIEKCKREEASITDKLEILCAKIVYEMFNVPKDSINLSINLVDKVKINGATVQLDTIKDKTNFNSLTDIHDFNGEVHKRQVINAINFGYALSKSNTLTDYISEIYKINPNLIQLYRAFIVLNRYALYLNNLEAMTEHNNLQIGTVELKLSQIDEVPTIKSQGEIFPVLLCETIRGMLELFSAHGLPRNKDIAIEVLKRTDYLKAEPWYMRVGMPLWDLILSNNTDIDGELFPYLYRRICSLKISDFNDFMQNILASTKTGRKMLNVLMNHAENDRNNMNTDTVDTPDVDTGVITDNYIREEEL